MSGEDVTLKLGGDEHALVDALLKGGKAFSDFANKVTGDAQTLGKKLREVSGADVIGQANEYAKAVTLIGGVTKLTTDEKSRLLGVLSQAQQKYAALGADVPETFRSIHTQLTTAVADHQRLEAEARRVAAAEKDAAQQAANLATRVKEVSGADTIKSAHDYADAVTAIGGTSKLTASEKAKLNATVTTAIEKYQALGQQAPASLRRIAEETAPAQQKTSFLDATLGKLVASFTAANIIDRGVVMLSEWGTEAIKAAGDTLDLSDKIGVTTETIQEMSHVGNVAEVSLDELSGAAQTLLVRIERGNTTTREAVERFSELGLSWQQLRALNPDDQFNAIIDALERTEDPQRRARMAYDLLGGKAEPVLKAIAEGWRSNADQASKSSREQLQAADDIAKAYENVARKTEGLFKGFVVRAAELLHSTYQGFDSADRVSTSLTESQKRQTQSRAAAQPIEEAFTETLKKQTAAVAALSREKRAELLAADQLGKVTDDLLDTFGLTSTGLEILKARHKRRRTPTETQPPRRSNTRRN